METQPQSDPANTDPNMQVPQPVFDPSNEQPMPVEDEATPEPTSEPRQFTEPIAWQSQEGSTPQRGILWYVIFVIIIVALMAVAAIVIKSWTFVILLPVMAVALLLLSNKPARSVNYAISPKGVYVGDKLYDFSEFRAFGVINDRGQYSAMLLPVKRFSPGLTIYFSEADGEKIVDMLGARLPMQEIKPDLLEKIIQFTKL